jgi:copper resistance protein B
MRLIFLSGTFLSALFFSQVTFAKVMQHGDDHPKIFHAFTLDSDLGKARDGSAKAFELDGWVGGDFNRLWLKSENKSFGKYDKKSEVQALYGRNISKFWDAQIGLRHDFTTDFSSQRVSYLSAGFQGLAPYIFETEAHVFLSDRGNFSARVKQKIDILLTQKLIAQPYFEADLFAQNVPQLAFKSGLSELEFGVLTRYEISKKFSPYFSLRYNRKTFGTAKLAQKNNDRVSDFIIGIGLRLRF